ncbi:MAG TPA: hypothetical protein VE863_22270, partial [Pyrinomonadaceae bacterium]|nr:hypothetical protein [Pyrinomonadaceae bacterium]
MSSQVYRSQDVVAFDDVLADREFNDLFRYLNSVEYTSVHARAWRKVWRLHDGDPLTGRAGWYLSNSSTPLHPSEQVF